MSLPVSFHFGLEMPAALLSGQVWQEQLVAALLYLGRSFISGGQLARDRTLVNRSFSFSTCVLSAHCFLASQVFKQESAEILTEAPLGQWLLSCWFQDCFCPSTVWLYAFVGVPLLESSYLEFIKLLGCLYSCFSSNLGSFQPLILQIFSVTLSRRGPHSAQPVCLMVIHRSPMLCSFFFSLFYFGSSDSVYYFHCPLL